MRSRQTLQAAISRAERCSPADFASVYCPRETISPAPVHSGPPPVSNRRVGHRRWPEESALSPAIPGLSMPWGDVLQGRRRPLLDPFHPLQLRTQLTQHGDQKKRCNESHHQKHRQQGDQPDRSHGRSHNPGEHGAQSPQPSRLASPRKLLHGSSAFALTLPRARQVQSRSAPVVRQCAFTPIADVFQATKTECIEIGGTG